MREVVLKTIEQNDNVSLYSICFGKDSESEFEKFMIEFKNNSEYKREYDIILLALEKSSTRAPSKGSLGQKEGELRLCHSIPRACVFTACVYLTRYWLSAMVA